MTRIGIVGYGYVGKIVEAFFGSRPDVYEIVVYDPRFGLTSCRRSVNECDVAVVCVPTPAGEGGECDASAVREVVGWVAAPLVLVRSTVPIGTTDILRAETGKRIVFSPEFAGEGTYWSPHAWVSDERECPFYVFGGDSVDCQAVIDLYAPVAGPTKRYVVVPARVAEAAKLFSNEYIAWKVTWACEMREACEVLGVPYWQVRDLWALDPRVDPMHTAAWAGQPGFGGKCLPKDTLALLRAISRAGYDKAVLRAVIERNMRVRPEAYGRVET